MAQTLSALSKTNMFKPRVYYIEKDYNIEDLLDVLNRHEANRYAYQVLEDYYRGNHVILQRTFVGDDNKPNNKLVNNFAKVVTDNSVSYFMGKPVKYATDSNKLSEEIEKISEYNHEDDVNAELAKLASIYGHAFEVHWIDEEAQPRFKQISPKEMFMCYSTDIDEKPIVAVSYRTRLITDTDEVKYFLSVYTENDVVEYEGISRGSQRISDLVETKRVPHYYQQVPVIEYVNNNERMGDYETVISLIDAYNLACSDSINDINYMNDAYLMLRNLSMTEDEDIADMKNDRVLLLDDDGDAKWLVKQINDTHVENVKKRLVDDIHKFSMTPALADEKFASNLSGVAISFKLIGLENKTAGKERKFKTSLQNRLKLLIRTLNLKGNSFDVLDIKPVFTRNIPQNLAEVVNAVTSLQGIVPLETLLEILPMVDDPKSALEKLKEEEEEALSKAYPMSNEPDYDMGEVEDNESRDKEDTREVSDHVDNRTPRKSDPRYRSKASKTASQGK